MIECALPESSTMEGTIQGSYKSHKVIPESPMIDGAADGSHNGKDHANVSRDGEEPCHSDRSDER